MSGATASQPSGRCVLEVGRRHLAQQAVHLRDGVRQSRLPLPLTAVTTASLSLIIYALH